ncbi:MAG TPA: electron transfer flavoprotein subunit beta [Nitrososphaeraceae archaeon]|nr:electron transfer flavoprotein subunit beta [Nitrososphaeraceae archaeon]
MPVRPLNVGVIVKLEPDFSEGNVSYNPDGTLNRAETKNILGPHSAAAALAAFFCKVKYDARVAIGTMGPPIANQALKQAQIISNADELHLYSDRIFAGADTLATAEALRLGVLRMNNGLGADIVISGHRASDGETGQTGPQTAWKLGYPFIGNVIDFHIDQESRYIYAKRLISLYGFYDVIEEIQAPLPVFISADPSYNTTFNTVSERLSMARNLQEAKSKADNFEKYLHVYNSEGLGADPKLVGLPGSPTIVYRVEKIPKAKAKRRVEFVDGNDINQLDMVAKKLLQFMTEAQIK